jgi:hypothetical protein
MSASLNFENMLNIELAFLSHGSDHFWNLIYLFVKTNIHVELLKLKTDTLLMNIKVPNTITLNLPDAVFVGLVFIVVALVISWLYGKNLKEVKETINSQVQKEVLRQIESSVSGRISTLEEIIKREYAIGETNVRYLLFSGAENPLEYQLLDARGFNIKSLKDDFDNVPLNEHVFVLDLLNSKYSEAEKDSIVNKISQRMTNKTNTTNTPIFVIYVRERLKSIENIPSEIYYLPANSKVTLIDAVVKAANISYAIRRIGK